MAEYEKFTFDKGSDIAVQLELVDTNGNKKDLTNFSAAAKMKRNYNSDSADTTSFAAAISTPPTDGILTLSLTNAQTDALRVGNYVYDVEISSKGISRFSHQDKLQYWVATEASSHYG